MVPSWRLLHPPIAINYLYPPMRPPRTCPGRGFWMRRRLIRWGPRHVAQVAVPFCLARFTEGEGKSPKPFKAQQGAKQALIEDRCKGEIPNLLADVLQDTARISGALTLMRDFRFLFDEEPRKHGSFGVGLILGHQVSPRATPYRHLSTWCWASAAS